MKIKVSVSLFLFLFCFVCESHAGISNADKARLLSTAQDQKIPVIVRYDNFVAQRMALDSKDLLSSGYDARLTQAQTALSQRLKDKQVEVFRSFDTIPFSSMRVNRDGLVDLLNDSNVTVFEDKILWPALSQSVPRVYPSQNSSPYHGNNQWVVAVLDSGVDKNHPNLVGKVVSEACYSNGDPQSNTSSLCPSGVASSTQINSGLPCTISGCEHGTMIAGIAAGNGSSRDGVARDAKLISIKIVTQFNGENSCGLGIASCVGASTSDLIAGLERVYALRNTFDIAAVNVSFVSDELFSGTCDDQPEKDIIDLLKQANIAVIAPSGNFSNTFLMPAPACISSAIAVAASFDNSDTAWPFNNTSNALDLFAPGVDITAPVPGGGFSTGTGTSLAAPHVAGAWAVIRHAAPTMSVNAVTNLLKSVGPTITQNNISRRRINITSALNALFPASDDTYTF